MKKITLFIILTLSIISCNNKEKEANTVLSNNWEQEMKLDNNTKWKANFETTKGVRDLQNLIKTTSTVSLDQYIALAKKLNERKNILVKECTMEGPSHDNLHIFLYPLITKINMLLEAQSNKEASEIVKSISENLKAYNSYFK
ncbi:MAG: hypothetical protein P8H13_08720 [Polaribacter sp.]|nr:hypothetical protein [Polaribacter sp.]MDG1812005.1 hypothetical protein [Polaribacter sp.]MDG1994593.1 hypothetical protein [Polaribacter sp.]